MKAIAQQITTLLKNDATVNALVNGRVYWGLGKQKEKQAAVIFSVEEIIQGATSDSRRWGSTLRCYGEDMDVASDVYEAVRTAMKGAGHNFRGGLSGISDDETREAVTELIFELT